MLRPKPPSRNSFDLRLLLIFVFSLAVAARLLPGARTIDDSYITFRYARNILAGNGFVYNPGERVLGTTTPLYALLLTSIGFMTGGPGAPFPQIALLLNAVADGFTAMLLLQLGRKFDAHLAGLGAALAWAIAPFSVTFAIGGLETSLYVLLLTATVAAHLAERRILATFLAALALLTRPDALILLGPLAVDRAWQIWISRRSLSRRVCRGIATEILAFLLPCLGWFTFAYLYFGNLLPHSIAAKSLAYRLEPLSALTRLVQHYTTPFLGHLTFGIPWIGVGLFIYPFFYLVGARKAWKAAPHAWPFLAFPWFYLITFAIPNPLIFRWYLTPPLPVYFLVILTGLQQILTTQLGRFRKGKIAPNQAQSPIELGRLQQAALVFFVLLTPVLLSLRGWTLTPDHGSRRPAPEMAWFKLELLYRQAASLLPPSPEQLDETSPVLAAGDVGVLGYYTSMRILDTVGLNSPISTNYYPADADLFVINYAIPPELILENLPDYIIILEVYGRAGLLKDTRFWENYQLRDKLSTDIYGSDGMLILERKR
ncbi:MAG: hypothetical protein AB1894_09610 [Chloroflexota bacterium]